ncbi:MAG: mandelate racemase/muconate lactonizing enzyme family protein [Candidatus Tectomicrobia bacterium]|uniref:Mandelate racemase/muconate lactonizing enzyme family protein n=1 Tax=Tectimicrobiota bacterium TaxID=2528274 RepID=A0A937W3L3_UNCTE|nr:mandelate racemase/muconate lactonizing enzyme family protein [Candidatus Tectomicrobia bacterium]
MYPRHEVPTRRPQAMQRERCMKVTHAKTRIIKTPADNPLVVGIPVGNATREFVTLELGTDDGIEGIGLTFFGGPLTGALREAVDALAALIMGDNPLQVEAIAAKLRLAASGAGPGGIFTLAMSAIDIALWDIKGKALGQSVHALLGGYRDRAPTYASGALMRQHPTPYLAEAGPRLVDMGFQQMKTQMGAEPTIDLEVERIRVLREGIGENIDLMCDINQLWTVNQAIDIGRKVEPYHLFWLEDVVAHDDYQGLARVADALTTPIAAGEYHYGIRPFRHMLEARSIDIVMIDLLRAGGITQWMKIAGMAEAFNVPVVSHLIPEIHVHLVAAIPHGLTVEYMPWTLRLFEETPAIVDGQLVVPNKPGLGLAFDQATFKQYQVS